MVEPRSTNFLVSVGDTDSAYDLVRQAITIKPGFRTRIKVVQSEVIAASDLNAIDIEGRKCRFPYENINMRLFNNYSLNGCQFECAMKKSKEKCFCIPWDFPRTDEEYNSTAVCDLVGSFCFLEEMKKVFF